MRTDRLAKLSFHEIPAECTVIMDPRMQVLSHAPVMMKMTGGLMRSSASTAISICSDIEGALCVAVVEHEGEFSINVQLDVAHPHTEERHAGAWLMSIADVDAMATRLRAVVDHAKFEAKGGG